MAKSKSTNTLPRREVIGRRVEEQRRRVWQAQAICDLTSDAAKTAVPSGTEGYAFSQSAWIAMEAVSELLDSIAGALEGDVVLAPVTPEEKAEHEEAQS